MPLVQYPNRHRSLGPMSMQLARQKAMQLSAANAAPTIAATPVGPARGPAPTNPARPNITGWQNYTGRTMGPVGQFSRVPGFGRQFRG